MTRQTSEVTDTNKAFDPSENYERTRRLIGYTPRQQTPEETYRHLGFKSGLEIHQQLLTAKKLFCHCPAGIYQHGDQFDAEVIRHMRPTLSEMGEYDGTALMEKRTKKTIVYRIANETACTYDIDDTPPFKIDREALDIALEISLLLKTNIVGELHITRKQYLDGSIPTGFQRTAIIGIEGEIPLRNKKVRIIQLSIEEDSCREVSDIRHTRVYTTDRLGMPLVEMVTYPDMLTPDEAAEAGQYLRTLVRTTGRVRTGIGAGREDVNVSITGGTRVEIKGVAHIKWIPELTHNEAFRQKALLQIREILKHRVPEAGSWEMTHVCKPYDAAAHVFIPVDSQETDKGIDLAAVNLPHFKGLLSFFTQPDQVFADELIGRLKVIACLEKPNLVHSESTQYPIPAEYLSALRQELKAGANDAQLMIWGPPEDVKTALDIIEERCRMAFDGVPNETRKSLPGGITIFERVLPGPDRMYPDTDSAPIPVGEEQIETARARLPVDLEKTLEKLRDWKVPEDAYYYLITRCLIDPIERVVTATGWSPSFVAVLFGHTLKGLQRRNRDLAAFPEKRVEEICRYITDRGLHRDLAKPLLSVSFRQPSASLDSLCDSLCTGDGDREEVFAEISQLSARFHRHDRSVKPNACRRWIVGQLKSRAMGTTIPLAELSSRIEEDHCNG